MLDHEMLCIGCKKHPSQIEEYIQAASGEPEYYKSAADYCWREEGTMNRENGHFLCTSCYIKAGCPSSPRRWRAP